MDTKTMQRMRKHIAESEGTLPNPYKDTKGKLTGTTATPLPTASQWPQAEPGTGNGPVPEAPAMPAPVDNPGKAALLKPVEKLTQSEMTDMINSAQGDSDGITAAFGQGLRFL